MGRILAIDYGTKRTGIAVTDPLKIIATPLDGVRTHDLIEYLSSYFSREEVEEVVVGWPTQDDGSPTNNTPHVERFVTQFKKKFPEIKVALHDEWNTSNLALESMIAGGTSKKYRRNKINVDKVSAVIILQSYLES